MTLQQEAYSLIQKQPDRNLRIIIDLLKALGAANTSEKAIYKESIKRTGTGRDIIKLPDDFIEHFDDRNDEISELFNGGDDPHHS